MPLNERPPVWLRRVVGACLPVEDERSVLQDLDALHAQRVRQRGLARANLWYARQTLGFMARVAPARIAGFVAGPDGLRDEVRMSVRSLLRRPAFAIAFVFTLAVGIGVLSTVYAAARWVLLRPVPGVRAPESLVVLRLRMAAAPPHVAFDVSHPDLELLRDRLPVGGALAGSASIDVDLSSDGAEPRRVAGEMVSANYFSVLGTPMLAGRSFVPSEDRDVDGIAAAIVNAQLARSIAPSARDAVGKLLRINGSRVRVVGVTPEDFHGAELPGRAQLWLPLSAITVIDPSASPGAAANRSAGVWRKMVGRPARITPPSVIQAEANAVIETVRKEFQLHSYMPSGMVFNASEGVGLDPAVRASVRRTLAFLAGASTLLLLLAIANLANLTLVRATMNGTATAIRYAIGASRARIARMVLVDALVLGTAGSVGALGLALIWARWYQNTQLSERGGALAGMHVDLRIVALALGVALLASAIAFLKPAVDSRLMSLESQLRRGRTGAPSQRLRMALVSTQVGLTVVLLVGATLLGRTVSNLRAVDLGFDPNRILSLSLDPHLHGYESRALGALARQIEERVSQVPGVRAVGLISPSPLRSGYMTTSLFNPAAPPGANGSPRAVSAAGYFVSPGFLEAVGAHVIAGDRDWRADSGSAVLTRGAVALLYPGEDPRLAIGRLVPTRSNNKGIVRIAAVIEDLRLSDITAEPPPAAFLPLMNRYRGQPVSAFVASDGKPERLAAGVRRAVAEVSSELPLYDVRSARAAVDQQFAERNAMAHAASTLGLIGLLLAASGLYGVLANIVAARRREFGIRSAMGAGPRRILRSVMVGGLVPVAIGLVAGLAGATAVSRALRSQLFALDRFDPLSYSFSVVTLLAAASVACAIPAWRASRVSPAEVLRDD